MRPQGGGTPAGEAGRRCSSGAGASGGAQVAAGAAALTAAPARRAGRRILRMPTDRPFLRVASVPAPIYLMRGMASPLGRSYALRTVTMRRAPDRARYGARDRRRRAATWGGGRSRARAAEAFRNRSALGG